MGPWRAELQCFPAERLALRQPRLSPLASQHQVVQQAQANQGNWAKLNNGHPATAVLTTPVVASGVTHPLAAPKFVPAIVRSAAAPAGSAHETTPNGPAGANTLRAGPADPCGPGGAEG